METIIERPVIDYGEKILRDDVPLIPAEEETETEDKEKE